MVYACTSNCHRMHFIVSYLFLSLSLSLSLHLFANYILVRLTVTIDMSETTKFVYLTWIGKDLPFTRRGKYGVKSGAVQSIFEVTKKELVYSFCSMAISF